MNVGKVFLVPASVRQLCVNPRDLRETIPHKSAGNSLLHACRQHHLHLMFGSNLHHIDEVLNGQVLG